MLDSLQVTMQSHELVVKYNSISQTSKVQRVKIKEGRGAYTEGPWQTGWNPSSSRTTSGPLDSSRVQGPPPMVLTGLSASCPAFWPCWDLLIPFIDNHCCSAALFYKAPDSAVTLALICSGPLQNVQGKRLGWRWKKRERRRYYLPQHENSFIKSKQNAILSRSLIDMKIISVDFIFSYFHKTTSLKEQK